MVLFHEEVVVSGEENILDMFFLRMKVFWWDLQPFFYTCRMCSCVPRLQLPEVWKKYQGLIMSQLLLLGKFEYTGEPIFKVVLEC